MLKIQNRWIAATRETLNSLLRAIQSSIVQYLFLHIVQKAYLFQGVSHDFLFQLVSEMDVEYFPLKGDVILYNDAPSGLYIFVSGAVNLISHDDGHGQVMEKVAAGDVFGEVGDLCCRPQPYTVRATELCQILRMNATSLMNIIKVKKEDGSVIMRNLCMVNIMVFLQKLNGPNNSSFDESNVNPRVEPGTMGGT